MMTTEPKHTVLIVDDVPENIQVLSTILYQKGVNVAMAQNGPEAFRVIEHRIPDLILLDVLMPEMDGFEVCRLLKERENTREVPVIFLTAKTQPDDILHGFRVGGVDYITKPFAPDELLARVMTHLDLKASRDTMLAQQREIARQHHELQTLSALVEQQYRLLVENVTDGIGIVQDDNVVFVNDALASMLGYRAEDLLGNPLEDLARVEGGFSGDESGEQWQVLQCLVRSDGREVWIEGHRSAIVWEGRPAILVSMRDISQHKQRELQIEEEKEALRRQNVHLKTTLRERYRFGDIIGKSRAMQAVYELILSAAGTAANVMICGESGTGKELIARTIHQLSERRSRPFVPVNCGAIPEGVFESEAFGHKKGAFTGAYQNNQGFFERARGGTLFLDELEVLNPAMQAKLLRAVDGGGYTPVGGNALTMPDIRIVAATNQDLEEQVERGLMREDFFYRLSVIVITIPPLRQRKDDLPLLIDYFLQEFCADASPPTLSGSMLNALYDYDWPGNVRELQNTIQRFLATNRLDFLRSRKAVAPAADIPPVNGRNQETIVLTAALEAYEKHLIASALQQNSGNQTRTARQLGMTRRSLIRRIAKYRL